MVNKLYIDFLNLNSQIKTIKKKIIKKIENCIKNSEYIGGMELKNFENNFKNYLGIKYCQAVANGTDALEIAIKSLNLKKNSEIIVPANTWISTAEAVVNNGLKVKFCDIDNDHNICPIDLEKKINKDTSAVIAVHLYGNPAKIKEILKICRNKKIKLIEDCAQAHGSKVGTKKVSTFGDIATFSFFPSKNLGCFGDGGAIVTNNKKYFIKSKMISNHGGLRKNHHIIFGRNSRLDNIQAAVLNVKLKKLDYWLKYRDKLANYYKTKLIGIGDIRFIKNANNSFHSNHLFVIKTKHRNKLKKYLFSKKIITGLHYPKTLPELPIFKKKHFVYCKNMNAIKFNKEILSLPFGEHLKYKELDYICNKIKDFF